MYSEYYGYLLADATGIACILEFTTANTCVNYQYCNSPRARTIAVQVRCVHVYVLWPCLIGINIHFAYTYSLAT